MKNLFTDHWYRIDEEYFCKIKDEQKLNVEFAGFLGLVLKLVNSCQKEPQRYNLFSGLQFTNHQY